MMYIELAQQTEAKNTILEVIEDVTGVPRELWEHKRTRNSEEVMIRHIYIYMLHHYAKYRIINIAHLVGLKTHPTVLQSLRRTALWKAASDRFQFELILLYKVISEYETRLKEQQEEQ